MISPSLYPHLLSLHLLPPLLLLPSPPLFSSSSHLFSPHLSSAPLLPSFPHFFSALPQVEQSLVAWLKLSGNKAKLYQINGSQTRDGGILPVSTNMPVSTKVQSGILLKCLGSFRCG